jgi:signal peptide peptidase SppA
MFDLSILNDKLFLADPAALRLCVAKLRTFATCPSAREVAEARRKGLDDARQAAGRAIRTSRGKVGVIPVHGPIDQRMSSELMKLGGTSTEEVAAALDALLADSQVEAIVLHVDSPGGHIYGVEELSDRIFAARGRKKIYAAADSMAASAGYWIASAAETLIVTPGGDVGSVGVYAAHVDQSKALEAEGLTVSLVSAGKYKVELSPYGPLAEEARGHLQEMVDTTYTKFTAALKRNRGVSLEAVRKDFGEGRLVPAAKALASKMVDRVLPFQDLMTKLTGGSDGGQRATAEVLRLRHEQAKREAALLGAK